MIRSVQIYINIANIIALEINVSLSVNITQVNDLTRNRHFYERYVEDINYIYNYNGYYNK